MVTSATRDSASGLVGGANAEPSLILGLDPWCERSMKPIHSSNFSCRPVSSIGDSGMVIEKSVLGRFCNRL